jgi:hypothetical protein
MTTATQQDQTNQEAIAKRIVELSNNVLSTEKKKSGIIVLKYESGPYSNAVVVRKSRVRFLIQSTDLFEKAKKERFNPKPEDTQNVTSFIEHKVNFEGLRLRDIEAHEPLFKEIVNESVSFIMGLRPKKN